MPAEKPRVSVLVPAYNAGAWIGRALESALAQTETRLEVVVADDASTDATAEIAAAYAARDARVRLLRGAPNRGPAAARNLALEAARGDWIALLDADDAYCPDRLHKLLALAEAHGADMAADNLLLCPEANGAARAPMIAPSQLAAPRLLTAAAFVAGCIGDRARPRVSYGFLQPVVRRAFLARHALRYDERNRFGEDFLFAMSCLLRGAVWWITPEPLYLYTLRTGSLTEIQSSADLGRIRAAERAWLGDPALARDRALRGVLRRHKRRTDRLYAYRAFTDAVKGGRLAAALGMLADDRHSLPDIALESLAQMPTILAKAARGGYRRASVAVPVASSVAVPAAPPGDVT